MRTVVIANQKGGCGKSITAINLSACLGENGKRVLLIDLDPQGHSTIGFGVQGDEQEKSMYEVMSRAAALDEIIISVAENVDLAPANVVLSAIEQQFAGAESRERRLLEAIAGLELGRYDYVIVDCPPNVGLLTFNAFVACTDVIIPIDTSYFSLHGLNKLLETINLVCERAYKTIKIKVLVANYDGRSRVSRDLFSRLHDDFQDKIFGTTIRSNVVLREATGKGRPITEYNQNSRGYEDYSALADEVMAMEVVEKMEELIDDVMSPHLSEEGVIFSFKDPAASTVRLAGDFNDWNPDLISMQFDEASSLWRTAVPLEPGSYQYRFVVDGEWRDDPNNPNRKHDPYGGMNSIVEVKQQESMTQ